MSCRASTATICAGRGRRLRLPTTRGRSFRVLRGIECDIVGDGALDLPDYILAELDWVQLSLHAGQRTTRRGSPLGSFMQWSIPRSAALSHPTGRLIGHRPENALDLERTFETALATGVALEVNGLPARLDLSGDHVREAIAAGVRIACSTDAHSVARSTKTCRSRCTRPGVAARPRHTS